MWSTLLLVLTWRRWMLPVSCWWHEKREKRIKSLKEWDIISACRIICFSRSVVSVFTFMPPKQVGLTHNHVGLWGWVHSRGNLVDWIVRLRKLTGSEKQVSGLWNPAKITVLLIGSKTMWLFVTLSPLAQEWEWSYKLLMKEIGFKGP